MQRLLLAISTSVIAIFALGYTSVKLRMEYDKYTDTTHYYTATMDVGERSLAYFHGLGKGVDARPFLLYLVFRRDAGGGSLVLADVEEVYWLSADEKERGRIKRSDYELKSGRVEWAHFRVTAEELKKLLDAKCSFRIGKTVFSLDQEIRADAQELYQKSQPTP